MLRLIGGHQRIDQFFHLSLQHALKLVQRETDTVVGDPTLREVIRAHALGTVAAASFGTRVTVLIGIALIMTVGVYGLVAGIVKLDDAGLWLANRSGETAWGRAQQALGRWIVRGAPWLMKALSVAGTTAMFLVGGGILTHGVPLLHHLVEDFGEEAADIPAVGTIIGPLAPMLVNALAGVVAGAVAFAIVAAIKRLRARGAAAT